MALSKIELKLGEKVIKLTLAEFEELKKDMRELDKQHHYYWYRYSYPYWGGQLSQPLTKRDNFYYGTSVSPNLPDGVSVKALSDAAVTITEAAETKDPPAFTGSVLSTS